MGKSSAERKAEKARRRQHRQQRAAGPGGRGTNRPGRVGADGRLETDANDEWDDIFARIDDPAPRQPTRAEWIEYARGFVVHAGSLVDPKRPADRAAESAAELITEAGDAHPGAVATGVGEALLEAVAGLWKEGWQPVDLFEAIRRRCGAPAVDLLLTVIAADNLRYAPDSVDRRWAAQLARLEAEPWWDRSVPFVAAWASARGTGLAIAVEHAISLLAFAHRFIALPVLIPPPGTAVRGGEAVTVDPKVLAKVRGLLAKAEATAFEEEAEAFSSKAQELMNRYALERALVESEHHRATTVGSVRIWLETPYVEAKSHLVASIAEANRCKSVVYSSWGFVALVGEEVDLEIAELLATSLLVQATRAMVASGSAAVSGTKRSPSFRRSFLLAYAGRIGERMREATVVPGDIERDERLLPVLADRTRVVEEAFDEMFENLVQKSYNITNYEGWGAGRAAADRADLGLSRSEVER